MPVLEWDAIGERIYQVGVDRGVLYLQDGTVIPWNGITSVEDNTTSELKSYYLDGIKILDNVTPGEFAGTLAAFTYPEEFDAVQGITSIEPGLSFHEQPSKSFNLSYRTKVGSDLDENLGYKIHLLYNIRAIPGSKTFETLNEEVPVNLFSWTLSGVPPVSTLDEHRPTVHISVDSRYAEPEFLERIEDVLYGTETSEPRFPSILEIKIIFGGGGSLFIIDNGNGTWTALDPSDDFITMLNANTFEIDHADATYLDADTYEISSTEFPIP